MNDNEAIDFDTLDKINRAHTKVTDDISKIPYEKVFTVINTDLHNEENWDQNMLKFLSGKSFEPFRVNMESVFKANLAMDNDTSLQEKLRSLQQIFYFNPMMFKSNKYNSKEKQLLSKNVGNYLSFLQYHQDNDKAMHEIFAQKKYFKFPELSKKISSITNDTALDFMNFRIRKVSDVLLKAGYSLWTIKQFVI